MSEDSIDRAWNRFNKAISEGDGSPYPGMAKAFETLRGVSWTDKDYRAETSLWAESWKYAYDAGRTEITNLRTALKRLSFAAQISGGTAGPDKGLQDAIQQAEQALKGLAI
jgi:hypothetical protein